MSSLEGKGNGVNGLTSVGTGFRLLHVAGLERRESPSDQVRGRPQTSPIEEREPLSACSVRFYE